MSWPPIQLVQTDTQTRKGWQPLRTAEFTLSPRSWLDSWTVLMATDCPSHPGVWNLSPLAPSYLLVSSWPQNRWKATDLYLGTSPICRQSMWSNIPESWCSYPSIPVQQESGSPSQGSETQSLYLQNTAFAGSYRNCNQTDWKPSLIPVPSKGWVDSIVSQASAPHKAS